MRHLWLSNIHPGDKERVLQSQEAAFKDSSTSMVHVEYRFYKANGEMAYVSDRAFILRNEAGEAVRCLQTALRSAMHCTAPCMARDVFSVLPQLGVTGGYMLTDRLKMTLGYTFMYWSRVVRPGDQIDLEVNPELIPSQSLTGDGLPARPQFVFRDTDMWVQGMNVGLEYQW